MKTGRKNIMEQYYTGGVKGSMKKSPEKGRPEGAYGIPSQ